MIIDLVKSAWKAHQDGKVKRAQLDEFALARLNDHPLVDRFPSTRRVGGRDLRHRREAVTTETAVRA
jgi:hypothetical protein